MGKELFQNIPSKVEDLVKGVRNGRIGLPDLQRPFVWKDNKVRELFDSMLKGYPIGYIFITNKAFRGGCVLCTETEGNTISNIWN